VFYSWEYTDVTIVVTKRRKKKSPKIAIIAVRRAEWPKLLVLKKFLKNYKFKSISFLKRR